MRVVHYLNQFFGGLGGEDKADLPPLSRTGSVGPGRMLEQLLGSDSQVVATIICGDNYAAENLPVVASAVTEAVQNAQADLVVAGPCFQAGRYGTAAGQVCAAVQDQLGVPGITAMALENPGVDLYREQVLIVDSVIGTPSLSFLMHHSLKLQYDPRSGCGVRYQAKSTPSCTRSASSAASVRNYLNVMAALAWPNWS